MPDFTVIHMQMCMSIDGPLTTHEGGYEQHNMFSERHWPSCTCKAYFYSKPTMDFGGRAVKPRCKHILRAMENVCGWHQQYSEEIQEKDGICPRCGGPTTTVAVAT